MKFDLICESCGYPFKAKIKKDGLQRILLNGNCYFHCPECTQEICKEEGEELPPGVFSIYSEGEF